MVCCKKDAIHYKGMLWLLIIVLIGIVTFLIFAIMPKRFLLYTLFLLFVFKGTTAQEYPTGYFIAPLDGILQLSGTFAELRGNHFHSGIDLRTGSKEGLPVKACADGVVVRIRISPIGFGKAIYINHPNGFTTVYAHLQGFSPAIDLWAREQQYKMEQFDVDLFPPKNLLYVKQGEIIARSGNSGSSEGPHVHFEVRETNTEFPVDPVLFGFPVKDFIRPTIHGLRVYPEGKDASVDGKNLPASLALVGWGPVYRLKISDTLEIAGRYSLGISATDLLNETSNRNGIVRYAVYVDSVLMFEWKAVRFSFAETRYINSFIDYPHYYSTNQRFMRTRIDPGNRLSMYSFNPTRGIFSSVPGRMQQVKVVLADSKNNESILRFFVKGLKPVFSGSAMSQKNKLPQNNEQPHNGEQPQSSGLPQNSDLFHNGDVSINKTDKLPPNGVLFTINKINVFSIPSMRISMPGKCLYDSIRFTYSLSPRLPGMLSPIYKVHDPAIPVQDYYDLLLKLDSGIKVKPEKLLVVKLNTLNKPSSVGGKYEDGFLKVKLREFGRYAIMADTIAPVIKALNISEGMKLNGLQEFRISISDNLSGINTYRATLNGGWILMEYDAKNRLLTYKRDRMLLPGENILVLKIEDAVGNSNISQWKLFN